VAVLGSRVKKKFSTYAKDNCFLTWQYNQRKPEYTAHKKSIISFIVRWCNYYNEIDIVKLRQLPRMMNYLPLSAHAEFGSISS
jgi:hypothetical protein